MTYKKAFDTIKMTNEQKEILGNFSILASGNEIIKNPYSGQEIELEPEAVAVYDIIKGSEMLIHMGKRDDRTIDMFNTALDVFIENWPKAYGILLD